MPDYDDDCQLRLPIADCRLPIAGFQITQNTWPQPEAEANVNTCATGQTTEDERKTMRKRDREGEKDTVEQAGKFLSAVAVIKDK